MTVHAATTGPGKANAAPGVAAPRGTAPDEAAPRGTGAMPVQGTGPAPVRGAVPAAGTPEEAQSRRPSLSPSRAADFKTCPLLYRFRSIDRLPERPTPDQLRGTLVHAVLDRLFDLPAADRVPQRAADLVEPEWQRMVEEQADLLEVFTAAPAPDETAVPAPGETGGTAPADVPAAPAAPADPPARPVAVPTVPPAVPTGPVAVTTGPPAAPTGPRAVAMTAEEFLAGARELLGGYFAVEDPRRLAPAERECLVSVEVDDGRLLLRGYIDRLDESPAGDLRVVDYKTGGAPREAFEARALFQLKFYALVLWRTRGVVPKVLRLLYLKDAEICDYTPEVDELDRFERTLIALWDAIDRATEERDFRPKPSRLCGWCAHQALCPAYGGTPPPFPQLVTAPAAEPPASMDD